MSSRWRIQDAPLNFDLLSFPKLSPNLTPNFEIRILQWASSHCLSPAENLEVPSACLQPDSQLQPVVASPDDHLLGSQKQTNGFWGAAQGISKPQSLQSKKVAEPDEHALAEWLIPLLTIFQ